MFDLVGAAVPQLGETNLKGPKNFVEVKFFTRAFFWARTTLMMTPCELFCHLNSPPYTSQKCVNATFKS